MPSCVGGEDAASRRTMRSADGTLALRHAVALGLLQGPAELLPVSSSGHTTLLPWLAGWPYAELDGELRKSFEVALHTGAGLALAIDMRGDLLGEIEHMSVRRAAVLALSLAPPTLAGFALRGSIERMLGGPRSIAAGLGIGAVAMAIADGRAAARGAARGSEDARALDGLALGIAQASALIPGISRNGATLTAARARGFARAGAQRLSWSVALPVLLGASTLKGARVLSHGVPRNARVGLAVGALSAFVSTLASIRILPSRARDGGSLLPYAIYRCALAGLVMLRLRRTGPSR
jgi:undecaprenyl-diphosphatase